MFPKMRRTEGDPSAAAASSGKPGTAGGRSAQGLQKEQSVSMSIDSLFQTEVPEDLGAFYHLTPRRAICYACDRAAKCTHVI